MSMLQIHLHRIYRFRLFVIVLTLARLSNTQSIAHNNYFLPGDSFFSVSISAGNIENWKNNKEDHFDFFYTRFDGDFMACGNLGYTKLRVTGIDNKFRAALTKAYEDYTADERPLYRLESDSPRKLVQVNSVVALIYNRDFKGPLGLKLNEDWKRQGANHYSGFVMTANAVLEDWRLSTNYDPLKIANKLNSLSHLGSGGAVHKITRTQLTIAAKDIQLALVGFAKQGGYSVFQTCPNLKHIFEQKAYTSYIVIKESSIMSLEFDQNSRLEKKQIR